MQSTFTFVLFYRVILTRIRCTRWVFFVCNAVVNYVFVVALRTNFFCDVFIVQMHFTGAQDVIGLCEHMCFHFGLGLVFG